MMLAATNAQLKSNFSPRYSKTINGDFTMIANNVLSRTATEAYTGQQNNHDFLDNVFVDIDNNLSTFNSSSANLVNPAPSESCLTIEKAYLYWSAADKEYEVDFFGNIIAGNGGNEVSWNYNEVLLMLPGSASYESPLVADEIIYRGRDEHFVNDPYVCVKDITSEVKALGDPFGNYQVANVKATEGKLLDHDGWNTGTSGGWQIIFIYKSPTLPQKNITLFDGYAHVTDVQNNFDITFDGFRAVPNGEVKANMVIGSLEGDLGISQDQLLLYNTNNIWEPLITPMRPANNFFNSSITTHGTDFLNRFPASTNTLGYDAGCFELQNHNNRLITNNQSTAVVRLTSDQETYGLYLLGMAIEVYEPSLNKLELYATASSENVTPGQSFLIYLDVANTGNDNIRDLVFSTVIPEELDFVSVEPLPDEITYSYDAQKRELIFEVADGFTDVSGDPYTIAYNVKVKDQAYFSNHTSCNVNSFSQTLATFSGEINTNSIQAYSSFTFDDCGLGNGDPTAITIQIEDTQAPIFVEELPVNLTVACDEVPDSDVLTAIDNCDPDPVVTFEETTTNDESCVSGYEIIRAWTATDTSGNEVTHTQTITIIGDPCLDDTEAPQFVEELPQNLIVDCESIPEMAILTAVDNCDPNPEVTFEETATNNMDCETGYEITRTWNAMDDSGNETTHAQIITVNPNLPCNLDDLVVSKTVTANGDGVNDYFEITGLETCNLTYSVKIFNRWGNIIYESDDYTNDWGAFTPENSWGNSGLLPSGTYYYIIGFGDVELKPVNGYIYIGSN